MSSENTFLCVSQPLSALRRSMAPGLSLSVLLCAPDLESMSFVASLSSGIPRENQVWHSRLVQPCLLSCVGSESPLCCPWCHITFFEVLELPAAHTWNTRVELLSFLAACFCVDGSLLQSCLSPTPWVLPALGKEFGGYSHFLDCGC